jgi:hypothetical protein
MNMHKPFDSQNLDELYAAAVERIQAGYPKWKIEAELAAQRHDPDTIRQLMARLGEGRGQVVNRERR